MATREEKETLDQIKRELALLSTDILRQADCVTDRLVRIRLDREAQKAWALAERIGAVIGE